MTFAHVFDIGAACVLAFFLVRGALRGLTGEIVSLLGLVASVFCGWTFAQPAADVVLQYFPDWDRVIVELVCSVAIFIAVSLIFAFIAQILKALVKAARLSFLDHVMGAVAGSARAFFLMLFIYGVVSIFPILSPGEWAKESIAMRSAAVVWPPVLKILTDKGWLKLDHLGPGTAAPSLFTASSQAQAESVTSPDLSSVDITR